MDEHGSSVKEPVVMYSMDRSKVRPTVLLYMYKIGREVSISDISRGTGICYSSVYGAMKGSKRHYSKDTSLLGMGLVEARRLDNNMILYSLTEKGHKFAGSLKMMEGRHDRDVRLDQEV